MSDTSIKKEIIVTDDEGEESLVTWLKVQFNEVHYLSGPRRGPAANRNYGAGQAEYNWLLFTDDDCIPSDQWVAAYAKYIEEHPDTIVMEGPTLTIGKRQRFDETAPHNPIGGEFFSCNIAIRADFFRQLGGFREDFPYAMLEDVEFKERVEAQTCIAFVPDAIVYHPWRRIEPKNLVHRLIISNKTYMRLRGRPANAKYRLNRLKLLLTCTWQNTLLLFRYRFRGGLVYAKMCWFYLAMVFISLKD